VQSTGRNLSHFAFTWDANNLYLFTERSGSTNNVQRFVYYADADNDGRMETGEPVIGVNWNGNTRQASVYLFNYAALSPGGDPMVDGSGFADGYTLPGGFINVPQQNNPSRAGQWGSADGQRLEFSVAWAELGIESGTAISFHVASANTYFNAASFAAQIDDNLGGCGGGPGTTQYVALSFVANQSLSGRQGEIVFAVHTLTNQGNGNDHFDMGSTFGGDHVPALTIYLDADGSGDLSPGDGVIADNDGDSIPDTGVLTPGEARMFIFAYQIASNTPYDPSGIGVVATTATSSVNTAVDAAVNDQIEVILEVSLVVQKNVRTLSDPVNLSSNPKAIPAAVVGYSVLVVNQGGGAVDTDSVVITDPVPDNTVLYVGDFGAPGSGPAEFLDGATFSGLTYAFQGLGDPGDDLGFSNDGGESFMYTPLPDSAGFDPSVTHIQFNPKGSMPGASAAGDPAFEIRFRVRVE
jgi:hypothetical protein